MRSGPGQDGACAWPWRHRGDVDPGEYADVDQVDVATAGGGVAPGQALDARPALAGVVPDCHQGECIGAAHYPAGRGYQVQLPVVAASRCAVCSGPGQGRA